ncbi:MAG: hypothetical protein ACREXV_05500 [Polaromonas sp.]
MKNNAKYAQWFGTLVGITLPVLSVGLSVPAHAGPDSLYMGDGGDDTVKRFDASTALPIVSAGRSSQAIWEHQPLCNPSLPSC